MIKPTLQKQTLIKLSPSYCLQHNLAFQTYCSHESCSKQIRVCPKCKPKHSSHHQNFFTPQIQVINDITTGLKKCFEKIHEYDTRAQQLTQIINLAQIQCKNQYQHIEKNMIELIKKDKQILQQKIVKMSQIHTRLEKQQRLKTYFSRLHQSNLLLLKISLSNQKGMLQMKEKNQKLCGQMSKSSFQQFQKLYQQFKKKKTEIENQLQNNFTFKLGQVIAMKNSRKEMEKNEKNWQKGKQNNDPRQMIKEKAKPKSTTNFGQDILNGIKNFLNL